MRIPVTILTGFLGSGKTTLLNKLVTNNHDKKIAVIENEFGEISIDSDLVVKSTQDLYELSNGCLCCTLNDELAVVLAKIVNSGKRIDHIFIETTGIANPGPVALSFLADEEIQSRFKLDAIIALADAKFITNQIEKHPEVGRQLAMADVILLNKIDLIAMEELAGITQTLEMINPQALIYQSQYGHTDVVDLFDIQAFSASHILKTKFETSYERNVGQRSFTLATPTHTSHISNISLVLDKPLDSIKFNTWMKTLLYNSFGCLYRVKGILWINDISERIVFQSVNNMYVSEASGEWIPQEQITKIVFIGKYLKKVLIEEGLTLCLYDGSQMDSALIYENISALQAHWIGKMEND